RYVSGDAAMRVFACGAATNLMSVQVVWRNGKTTTVENVPANSIIEINEADSQPRAPEKKLAPKPLFADASHLLGHKHEQDNFDDFAVQPSLLRKLSQAGPGVVWTDLTGDSYEDLLIGSGLNGAVGMLRNSANGKFEKMAAPFSKEETGALLAWKN